MRYHYYDVLKAIAIIAVVLYHIGICEYGYLGVDIFLVIAGYFTAQGVEKQTIGGGYFAFITQRAFRLLPLLLIAGIICLCWGWLLMLPDDFENMAQSVVATNFFGNNILQAITTSNYWDVVNEYKPLMHTWYVGLLMQFYIVIPLLSFIIGKRIKDRNKREKANITLFTLIGVVSLILYLIEPKTASKFYYLPYRLYEFCAGGLIFYLFGKRTQATQSTFFNTAFVLAYIGLLLLLFVDAEYVSRPTRLLITVGLSSCLMAIMPRVELAKGKLFANKWVAGIGIASYSIFVWHQVVLALMRYSFTDKVTETAPLVLLIGITAALSFLAYKYIERIKQTKIVWSLITFVLLLTTATSLYIYKNAGVVRDVPELEVVKGHTHRGMWAEYCDRAYQHDKNFSSTNKPKWFVIGNSVARDFVNIISESKMKELVEVSYSNPNTYQKSLDRFSQADYVFIANLPLNDSFVEEVRSHCPQKTKVFIVGEKNFGECNGQIYRHRFETNFHDMTTEIDEEYLKKNRQFKAKYRDGFIDMIEFVRQPNGNVKVFTNDGRFISQDCIHLTKAGAQYYATLIDWTRFR